MTYSLSGSGSHSIGAGVGQLYIDVTTIPSIAGAGRANPTNLYDVGLLRPGDGTAFWEPIPVIGGPQWAGLPEGTTTLDYALFNGAVISVTEVALPNPFRGPAGATGATGAAGPTGPAGPSAPTGTVLLGADAASIRLPAAGSFAGTGKNLRILAQLRAANASNNLDAYCQFNADTGPNYLWMRGRNESGNVTNENDSAGADSRIALGSIPANSAIANAAGAVSIDVPNYVGATFWKSLLARTEFMCNADGSGNDWQQWFSSATWKNTGAITSVLLFASAGNLLAGSQATYYEEG